MNNELYKLYKENWNELMLETQKIVADDTLEIKPANPLLLYIDEENKFEDGDIKLMFFGQETNNWYDERRTTIEGVQEYYDEFFNGEECWDYNSQFWNGIARFINSLRLKFPNKKITHIWNNILKIGKYQEMGTPPEYIYQTEKKYLKVIAKEIEITQPNLIIFFTGPYYDNYIKEHFPAVEFTALNKYSDRILAKVNIPNVQYAFRTYHPNYLMRIGIDNYCNSIIKDLNF